MARNLIDLARRRSWHSWIGLPVLLCAVMLLGASGAPALADGATSAQVTVNLHQVLSAVSPLAIGVNDAVWDGHLQDDGIAGLLRADGVRVMRFPGGSTADDFHWQTNTLDDSGASAGTDTFDQFMQVVQHVGATPIITVNYGSGTPEEAAAWVRYANITKHYHIRYWEIGNEIYGNSTYGGNWERDLHAPGPASYASNSLQFIQAMKAVDPSIQIGLVLTAPGNWPDGVTSASSPQPWNDTVLPAACAAANFVVVHWYPQGPTGETDAGLLAAPRNGASTPVSFTPSIPSMVSTLRSEISQYCGAHASAVQIMTTETNSVSYNPGKQTTGLVNALYLAENYLTWLGNGVASVDWWDVHNSEVTGTNDSSSLYGT
ncbi:MAG TPA: cellulose-binding protein, partial [Ktedonobacterales bacterium]